VASGSYRIDELDFEINGSSALRDHLEKARQLMLAASMEFEFAAAELRGRLEKTEPCVEKGSWNSGSGHRRRCAKQVARGYKRMAELCLAAAQMTPKTWQVFVRNYIDNAVSKAEKSKFDVTA
jgi:hypothetical protein